MDVSFQDIELFFLVLARTSAIFVLLPIFGSPGIPVLAKAGASFFISLLFLPMVIDLRLILPNQVFPFLMLLSREILVGLVIGFVTSFLFAGIQLAGQFIGMQMGFAIVNAIDPQTQQNVSLIAQFQNLVAMMIFITIDGHLFLFSGIKNSFEVIPLMGASFSASLTDQMIRMGAGIFISGVKIGAPIITTLLLTSVALGIAARVMPQMNVFFVGLPLKIGLGILVIALSLPLFSYIFRQLYVQFQGDFITVIRLLH